MGAGYERVTNGTKKDGSQSEACGKFIRDRQYFFFVKGDNLWGQNLDCEPLYRVTV